MGKVESIIKSEIVRLAKREVKKMTLPLRGEIKFLKGIVSQLRKALLTLQRTSPPRLKGKEVSMEVSPEEVKSARFSPRLIRSLRKRLRITQRELALLTGVTVGAIHQWERGKFKPEMKKREIMVALRKLGRREVRKMIEAKNSRKIEKKTVSQKTSKTSSKKK
jgi:DNA-binding transcriptional regulator YiaG